MYGVNLALIPLLGLAVASAVPCPNHITVTLAIAIGLLQGLANGSEITPLMSAWRFIPELAVAGVVILTFWNRFGPLPA
jgi:hydrogenase/urease accessory protein HupE